MKTSLSLRKADKSKPHPGGVKRGSGCAAEARALIEHNGSRRIVGYDPGSKSHPGRKLICRSWISRCSP
jgi:hypothetical protein